MKLIFLIISPYIFLICKLIAGLNNLKKNHCNRKRSVSIIVAAKNEEHNIEACIQAIVAQQYPKSLLDIIIVDDQSTDNTHNILKHYTQKYEYVNVLQHHPSEHLSGNKQQSSTVDNSKKYALDLGIKSAKGDVLIFTDADCVPPPGWVTSMINCFEDNIGVVIGFSPLVDKSHTFLGKLIEFDSYIAAMIAAAGTGLNFPITCTGRNFAYRKEIFEAVGGYNDIMHSISGDDDLFLHLVKKKTTWDIHYNLAAESIVPSYHSQTIAQFLHQKKRHISAGKYYPMKLQFAYAIIHITNLFCFLFLMSSFIFQKFTAVALSTFSGKLIFDFVFVKYGMQKFNLPFKVHHFFPWEFFYVGYHIISGPLAMFGKIKW